MPGGIRELVQQHEGLLAAVNDEPLLVVAGGRVAEDATRLLVRLGDVLEPPGRPELLRHGPRLHFRPHDPKILHVKRFRSSLCSPGSPPEPPPRARSAPVVPAGVAIGGVRVGGLNSEQARSAISWWYNRHLRFVFYGKRWSVSPRLSARAWTSTRGRDALRRGRTRGCPARERRQGDQAVRARPRRAAHGPGRGGDGEPRRAAPGLHAGKPGIALSLPKTGSGSRARSRWPTARVRARWRRRSRRR